MGPNPELTAQVVDFLMLDRPVNVGDEEIDPFLTVLGEMLATEHDPTHPVVALPEHPEFCICGRATSGALQREFADNTTLKNRAESLQALLLGKRTGIPALVLPLQ